MHPLPGPKKTSGGQKELVNHLFMSTRRLSAVEVGAARGNPRRYLRFGQILTFKRRYLRGTWVSDGAVQ